MHNQNRAMNQRTNKINYRGPASSPQRPLPWPEFLTRIQRGKPEEVERWYNSLPENERVDIRAGVRQAVALTGAISRLQLPDLFGKPADADPA